jgi:XTP/dITP diphosphohydrolase
VRLLLATTNQSKLHEIGAVLAGLSVELVTLADCPPVLPPEESGATFAENARAKALYYAAALGLPTVAEDSGLEIDALGGAPGVRSARFGGEHTSYPEKFALIAEALRARGATGSAARFVCAVALAEGGHVTFEASGTVEGTIAPEPRGRGGFGYDPIFYSAELGCTLAEAGARKMEVSHRARAFRLLREYLERRPPG